MIRRSPLGSATILSKEEVLAKLLSLPPRPGEMDGRPTHLRLHDLLNVLDLHYPPLIERRLHESIDLMLRRGCKQRDPRFAQTWAHDCGTGGSQALGRKGKDPALVQRDRYWALDLRRSTELSFAELERLLNLNITVTQRDYGSGHQQPFALSKVAAGSRGLSADWSIPEIVQRAEDRFAGTALPFQSIAWRALSRNWTCCVRSDDHVNPNLRASLRAEHLERCRCGNGWNLTLRGIELARHRPELDTFGLLLMNSRRDDDVEGDLAEESACLMLSSLLKSDTTLACLEQQIADVLSKVHPEVSSRRDWIAEHGLRRFAVLKVSPVVDMRLAFDSGFSLSDTLALTGTRESEG